MTTPLGPREVNVTLVNPIGALGGSNRDMRGTLVARTDHGAELDRKGERWLIPWANIAGIRFERD